MKTEYLILWIDDDIGTVETDRTQLRDHLEEAGIETKFELVEAKQDIELHNAISSVLNNPELDLIVVDYRMPEMNGKQLIEQIRDTDHIFLPVVFYSQDGVPALMDAARDAGLEGVYFAHRNNVFAKLKEVTTSLLKKEQVIKRTRGLLMEGVSEVDAQMIELIPHAWSKLTETHQDEMLGYLKNKILASRAQTAQKKLEDAPQDRESLEAYLTGENILAMDTYSRWRILKKILEKIPLETGLQNTFHELCKKDNDPSLNEMRNDYAHKTREQLKDAHNPPRCVYIRKELRKHLKNMKGMKDKVTS